MPVREPFSGYSRVSTVTSTITLHSLQARLETSLLMVL